MFFAPLVLQNHRTFECEDHMDMETLIPRSLYSQNFHHSWVDFSFDETQWRRLIHDTELEGFPAHQDCPVSAPLKEAASSHLPERVHLHNPHLAVVVDHNVHHKAVQDRLHGFDEDFHKTFDFLLHLCLALFVFRKICQVVVLSERCKNAFVHKTTEFVLDWKVDELPDNQIHRLRVLDGFLHVSLDPIGSSHQISCFSTV